MKKYITLILLFLSFLQLSAQCSTVASITENFDQSKSIPSCWDSQSGLSMVYVKNKRATFYSMMTPREDMYLMTPKLKAGNYLLTLDITDNGGDTSLELVSILNPSDKKSFVSISKPTEIKGGKRVQTFRLKKDAHLGLKVLLNDMHQAVYLDNLSIQPKK